MSTKRPGRTSPREDLSCFSAYANCMRAGRRVDAQRRGEVEERLFRGFSRAEGTVRSKLRCRENCNENFIGRFTTVSANPKSENHRNLPIRAPRQQWRLTIGKSISAFDTLSLMPLVHLIVDNFQRYIRCTVMSEYIIVTATIKLSRRDKEHKRHDMKIGKGSEG